MRNLYLFSFLLLVSILGCKKEFIIDGIDAYQVTIKGNLKNPQGEALANVNIQIYNLFSPDSLSTFYTCHTETDSKGNYSLTLPVKVGSQNSAQYYLSVGACGYMYETQNTQKYGYVPIINDFYEKLAKSGQYTVQKDIVSAETGGLQFLGGDLPVKTIEMTYTRLNPMTKKMEVKDTTFGNSILYLLKGVPDEKIEVKLKFKNGDTIIKETNRVYRIKKFEAEKVTYTFLDF